jgi:hypothetical protein
MPCYQAPVIPHGPKPKHGAFCSFFAASMKLERRDHAWGFETDHLSGADECHAAHFSTPCGKNRFNLTR